MDKKLLRGLLFILIFACSSVFISSSFVLAQEVVSKEMLLFAEVPTVITAARKAQPLTKAPAFVYVVTGDEIRRSGATNIPEALRMVPGLDVIDSGASDQQIAIRGFSAPLSDKVVVMVDGRSVYLDLHNVVLWDNNVLSMDDIDHVEIVEGPVSPLYGANAFSGVINIITKTPEQAKGTYVSTSITSPVEGYTARLLQGGVSKNGSLAYKLAFNWQVGNDFSARSKRDLDTMLGYGLLEYRLDKDKKLSFSAGRSDSPKYEMTTYGVETKMARQYFKFGYDQPNLFFHVFQDTMRAQIVYGGLLHYKIEDVSTDAEFQHSLDWGLKNTLVWGLNYHHTLGKAVDLFSPNKLSLDRLAAYFQNEYKMLNNLSIFAGGRVDKDDMSEKKLFSPMFSAVYSPSEKNTFRFSSGKAFKLPSLANALVDMHLASALLPHTLYNPSDDVVPGWLMTPNSELMPEEITSYELGYQGRLSSRLKVFANVYYSIAKSLISEDRVIGLIGGLPYFEDQFVNNWKAKSIGGETGFDYLLTDWLTGTINYSYVHARNTSADTDFDESPANKVNIGLSADWKNGFNANLDAHYVDVTRWIDYPPPYAGVGSSTIVKNAPYFLVNTRLGYRFNKDSMEVAFAIFNLLDDKHCEYHAPVSYDGAGSLPGADRLRRQITASFSYKF